MIIGLIWSYLSRNTQKLYSWESLARKAAWEQSASLATAQTPTSKYPPDSRIMSRLACCLACWLGSNNGLYQLKVDVGTLNTVKNELARVSSVSPSSENFSLYNPWFNELVHAT